MATPKRLNNGDGGNSYSSLQKHAAAAEEEEEPKKKTKNKKKKRIWNEDDELIILKGLVDYRVKTRLDPNFDWDGFFDFVRGSVHVKFSKEQLFSKIRKLRRKFLVHMDRINQGKDPLFTRSTDSQAFGYSNMIWGQDEAEVANGRNMEKAEMVNGRSMEEDEVANGRSMEKAEIANGRNMEEDEVANGRSMEKAEIANGRNMEENEVANGRSVEEAEVANGKNMEEDEVANGRSLEKAEIANGRSIEKDEVANRGMEKAMQIENGEDAYKEDEQVANEEPVNGNGAKKKRKFDGESLHDKTTDGKESHEDDDDDDDLCVVEEAFETMVMRGLSGYQKKLQLEKLRNLGSGKIKELSNEWKSLCAEEVKLNIKKLRFSVKLVEAANDGAV